MSGQDQHGINVRGLGAAFESEEALKSNLILEAQLLRAREQPDEAAAKLARAAEIEEHLAEQCETNGLSDKAWVRRFSAVCCWAQAGNFHTAMNLGSELLARPELPERLRQRVKEYTQSLRSRRAQWSAALVGAGADT
jgi:hypothetical protein